MASVPNLTRRTLLAGAGLLLLAACPGGERLAVSQTRSVLAPKQPPKPAFPLSTKPGVRHLVDAAGQPFMMLGEAAWSLIAQLSREDAVAYLDDRAARGFNTLLVSLLEARFATHAPANHYREQPFLEKNNYATPNEAYFAHAEFVLREAEKRGFVVLLTPSYIGYIGTNHGWYEIMRANGPERLKDYGRYVATRLGALKNIIWTAAGDGNPPDRSGVIAVAEGIREVAPAALQTAHNSPDTPPIDFWAGEPWLKINNVYTYKNIAEAVAGEYQGPSAMPVFFIEGAYENEGYDAPPPTEAVIRRQAFHTLLSGGCGYVFGNNPIWHFDGPGLFDPPTSWRGQLNSRGTQSVTLARTALLESDWPNLLPDLKGDFLAGGRESGEDRAVAAVTAKGDKAIVYMPSRRRIRIDLSRLSGSRVRLRWLDPSTGEATDIPLPAGKTGVQALQPPARNGAGFSDWVLLAETSP